MFRMILKEFFSVLRRASQKVGVTIDFDDGPELFFAETKNVLADKDALQEVFALKGHNGYSPCCRCDGLMIGALSDSNFPDVHNRRSTSVEINTLTKASFHRNTQRAINTMCDDLAHYHSECREKRLTKENLS